jgi:hypothetical protein
VRMTMYVEKGVEQMKVERMEANGLRWQWMKTVWFKGLEKDS